MVGFYDIGALIIRIGFWGANFTTIIIRNPEMATHTL